MAKSASKDTATVGDFAWMLFGVAFVAVIIAIVAGAFFYKKPDTALVLATRSDCVRSFDDKTCHAIVDAAMAIHAMTAPRFSDPRLCELSFGAGACRAVDDGANGEPAFAPKIAVILASHDDAADAKSLLPLYFGPSSGGTGANAEGRRVYYRGVAVGTFMEKKFGGAEMSLMVDLAGKSMTLRGIKKLRGG